MARVMMDLITRDPFDVIVGDFGYWDGKRGADLETWMLGSRMIRYGILPRKSWIHILIRHIFKWVFTAGAFLCRRVILWRRAFLFSGGFCISRGYCEGFAQMKLEDAAKCILGLMKWISKIMEWILYVFGEIYMLWCEFLYVIEGIFYVIKGIFYVIKENLFVINSVWILCVMECILMYDSGAFRGKQQEKDLQEKVNYITTHLTYLNDILLEATLEKSLKVTEQVELENMWPRISIIQSKVVGKMIRAKSYQLFGQTSFWYYFLLEGFEKWSHKRRKCYANPNTRPSRVQLFKRFNRLEHL